MHILPWLYQHSRTATTQAAETTDYSPAKREVSERLVGKDALEGKAPQRRPDRRPDRRLEEVAKAIGGGYCRLQMPFKLALGVRETVAGHRLGALGGGGGGQPLPPPPPLLHPCGGKGGGGGAPGVECHIVFAT